MRRSLALIAVVALAFTGAVVHARQSSAALGGSSVFDVSWLGPDTGWALLGPRAQIARTDDGGRTWTVVSSPRVGLTNSGGCVRLPCVGGLRFATPAVGYLFDPSLRVTSDGGRTWRPVSGPPVESLDAGPGGVVRVAYDHAGCPGPCTRTIEEAAPGSNSWRVLLRVPGRGLPERAIASTVIRVGREVIYVPIYGDPAAGAGIQQTAIWRSLDGGRTWTLVHDPCGGSGRQERDAIDVAASPGGLLAALCMPRVQVGPPFSVTTSTDGGRTWSPRRTTPGHEFQIAPAGSSLIAVTDGTTVELSTDGGGSWSTAARDRQTSGSVTGSLVFQTAQDGSWVSAVGAIWTTTDGGRRWTRRGLT